MQSKLSRAFSEKFHQYKKAAKGVKAKPTLEFIDDQKVIQMKLLFRRAKIFPEENEYFMRLD